MKALKRREFLRVSAATLGVGVLAACQPKVVEVTKIVEVEKVVKETVVVEKEAAPVKAMLEGRTGVLWGISYEHHVKAYERCCKLFKEQTGCDMKIEPESGADKFIAALAAGIPPDIECAGIWCMGPLYIRNVMMEMEDAVFAPMGVTEKDFWGDAIQAFEWKGKHYGVPVEANNCGQAINVPIDDMVALGLRDQYPPHLEFDPPMAFFESFESMWELARKLQVEEDGVVTRWGLTSSGWDFENYLGVLRSLLADEGTDWFDEGKDQFNIDTEAGVLAMQMHAETPVKMGIETVLDVNQVDALLAGKAALGRGNLGPSTAQGRELGYNYMIAGAPKINGKLPLFCGQGGWGYIAPREAKNLDISVEFLKMMCTTPGQVAFSRIYGGAPSPSWAALAGVFDHYADPTSGSPSVLNGMINQMYLAPQTTFAGVGEHYIGANTGIFNEVGSEVRRGTWDSATACKELQSRCEKAYAAFKEDIIAFGA